MTVVQEPTLEALKTALRLEGVTISDWTRTLRNPEGNTITRTSVYQALRHGSPQWLVDEIISVIRESRRKYATYYSKLDENV